MSLSRWRRRAFACLALLTACSQSEPFTNPDVTNEGPLAPTEPLRLTYNIGEDSTPAAHPDGASLLYSFTRPDIQGRDQCLALLPAGGGTQRDLCPNSAGSRDSTDFYAEPAWIDGNTIALRRAARLIGRDRDDYVVLGTATAPDFQDVTARVRFPYSTPAGLVHLFPTHVTPLGGGRVAYIAETQLSGLPCGNPCPYDWTHAGREVMVVDLAGDGPPTSVPGTDYPTGLSLGPDAGDLLFTRADDSRVFRRAADGTVDVLHDFGAVARDVTWRAGRLAAIVGGDLLILTSVNGEPSQVDGGGTLAVVDLATGEPVLPADTTLRLRRPSLAPDGRAVFVQTGATAVDLYRVAAP
ncbi:MAG TPA: hypothetical protein VFY20_07795 [Gemmatimonadales bacterium]|nr:hypothetical protein [Gemmatimonadales bacterium]